MAATPARQEALGRPATTTVRGTASSAEFIALLPKGLGCAGNGETSVILSIENKEGDSGGNLKCVGVGGTRTLTTWERGAGALAYRLGSEAWSPVWPPADQDERAWALSGNSPLVRAPFVKFEVTQNDQSKLAWSVQAGVTAPVEFDPMAVFVGGASGGDGF